MTTKRKKKQIDVEYYAPGRGERRKMIGEISGGVDQEIEVKFRRGGGERTGLVAGFFRRAGIFWRLLWDKDYRLSAVFRWMLLLLPIWVISPIDPVPDFIFGIGFLDDLWALLFSWRIVGREIDRYLMIKKGKE